MLKHIDEGGPAQEALTKAAAMTAEARQALEGLDEEASVDEVATRLEGRVSPAVLSLVKAQVVQAGGFGTVTRAVEGFGGFAKQYEQIEKVSAHHGNFWEVLLYGQIGRDRAVMFDLAGNDKLKFTATSEDSRILDALAHAQRYHAAHGEYITTFNEEGEEVDISFATQNWRKAVVDKTRAGLFVRKHFEAMVFTALAEELRTGDIAVVGSEEYADWSEQLLVWEVVQETLGSYLVEVGLAEPGESAEFDAKFFRLQLEDKLRSAAAAADAGYPENDGLVIDPETGIPSLKAFRADGQRPSAKRLEQEIKARMPERSLMGIVARTVYWVEWWRRFGPPSGLASAVVSRGLEDHAGFASHAARLTETTVEAFRQVLACILVVAVRALRMRAAELPDIPARAAYELAAEQLPADLEDRSLTEDVYSAVNLLPRLAVI